MTAEGPGKGHGAKGPAVRDAAVLAVITERTLGQAAKRAGVSEKSLRRWLADDPEFQAELSTARRAVFNAGVERVQGLMGKAVAVLEDLLAERKSPSVRLGAARLVVELAINRHDVDTLVQRVDKLEQLQRQEVPHESRSKRRSW